MIEVPKAIRYEGVHPSSRAKRAAGRLVLFYIVISLIWIFGSDSLVENLNVSPEMRHGLQSSKGTLFVLAVGLLLHIGTRRLIEQIDRANRSSGEAKLELVHRLALAAEYRDDVTGAHNYRISCFAEMIASQMGYNSAYCELIFHAASLHDIGKIAIPDSVLLKRGPLTEDERGVMEQHVSFGANLLAGGKHDLLRMAHNIALTHHERWDGTGYPSGLAGSQIPIEGSIVAVCDVFDALTNERPYKAPWPMEDAVREIESLSGSAFNPAVVEAFKTCLPAIRALKSVDPDRRWTTFRSNLEPSPMTEIEFFARAREA